MEDNKNFENEAVEETSETSQANNETAANTETESSTASSTTTNETASRKSGGVSASAKAFAVIVFILALGVGLLVWKIKVGSHHSDGPLTKITNEDFTLLLKDENPMTLKQLAENPGTKKKIVENLKQNLAIASQAYKDGFVNRQDVKQELEDLRVELVARLYDMHKNQDKGPMPPFGWISEDQVKEFYNQPGNEEKFKIFIDRKIETAKKDGRIPSDREPSPEEIATARDYYAKARIYEKEAKDNAAQLGEEFNRKVELQVKLQQASFLTRLYSEEVLKKKVEVTDADIRAYLQQHPELDTKKEKLAKAEELIQRINAGEDFAQLAKEFSEDPGSKDKGGLYENIRKGQFVAEFETAALALEPGQVAQQPVESRYGYHIIKLEKKGTTEGANGEQIPVFDARHILISTMVTDPENPQMPPMPAEDRVRAKLEEEKQKQVLDEIMANNPIDIPEDFTVPEPSPEKLKEMEEMQKKQMEEMLKLQRGDTNENDKKDSKSSDKKSDQKKK